MISLIQQHWGNGRYFDNCQDVCTADRGETVVVRLRDPEGQPYGTARMTRQAAEDLVEHLTAALEVREKQRAAMRRGHKKPFLDLTPSLRAREMGGELFNMAVLHESVNGSRQDAPLFDTSRPKVYVKVMAALRTHCAQHVASYTEAYGEARLKEHVKDVITSLPDQIVLHLNDLWDDCQTQACAEEYMACSEILRRFQDDVLEAERQIGKNAA